MNETRRTITLEGIITLLSPLSHIGEVRGTDSLLLRSYVIGPDGRRQETFRYNGNAWRGMLRDHGSLYLFEKLGDPKMGLDTLYLFTSGGAIAGEQVVDLDRAEKIRALFPLLSIFGGGAKSQILEGKLHVGFGIPLVRECQSILPERFRNPDAPPWRLWTEEVYFTRQDDAKKERFKRYLQDAPAMNAPENREALPEARPSAEQESLFAGQEDAAPPEPPPDGLAANAEKKAAAAKKKENPQQMRAMVECLCAGAQLYQRIDLVDVTDLELGAFVSALDHWSRAPYIGGKCGAGFGLCEVSYDYWDGGQLKPFARIGQNLVRLGPAAAEAKQAYDEWLRQLYDEYLTVNAAPMRAMLEAARVEDPKAPKSKKVAGAAGK